MWFIPTRNRPDAIRDLISAMELAGSVPECAVMIDGPLEPYEGIQWPVNWHIHHDNTHLELCGAMNALFKLYPNEKTYGFITDHGRPESANWAQDLESAAGDWRIALCNDSHNRFHDKTGNRRITEATCFGGELVRALGYVLPDFVTHLYADDVWEEIGHELDLVTWCEHVWVRSLQFSKGEIPIDDNHKRLHRGVSFAKNDYLSYIDWRDSRKSADLKKLSNILPGTGITIACVKWGKMYGAEYVNILCNMVARNLPAKQKVKFVCFTDDAEGINHEIEIRPLPESINGWWNKLYLFKSGVFEPGERVVYFDLDTVIVGPLDDIIQYSGKFAILRDFYRPDGLGSGVMMWEGGNHYILWDSWVAAGKPEIAGGDQAWIEKHKNPELLQELYPHAFVSYKVHASEMFPKNSRVVCFHGEPKPHNAGGWVEHVWKLGGGTALSLEIVCNTAQDNVISNIKHAITLDLPLLTQSEAHDGIACIIGGAPSLKQSLDEIKMLHKESALFATNNAYAFLYNKGIAPDYHVMMDSREKNAEFVPAYANCFYASRCHPSVFKKAKSCNVILWHELIDGIQEITKQDVRETAWVGAGSSVGLKAMSIAYILGYRTIHLYGMDSSYAESHHAYPQPLNDGENVIEVVCNGKAYNCAPWMVTQAEEFKELAAALVEMGCAIVVHGTGLIPDIAKLMSNSTLN